VGSNSQETASTWTARRRAAALAIGTFVVYNANLRYGGCGDDEYFRLLPIAFVEHHTLGISPFLELVRTGGKLPHYLIERGDRLVPLYPPTTGILSIPFYVLFRVITGNVSSLGFAKFAASAMVAASVPLVYSTGARRGLTPRLAMVLAVVYALGTPVWTSGANVLCQHAPGAFLVALVLYACSRLPEGASWSAVAAVAGATLVAVRPQSLLLVAPLVAWATLRDRSALLRNGALAAVPILPLVVYNLVVAGHPLGGYTLVIGPQDFGLNPAYGAAALLVSPGRGLLVFCPVAVFAFAGALDGLRRRDMFLAMSGAGLVLFTLFLARYRYWYGGASYGPRFYAESSPILVILAGAWLQHRVAERRRDLRASAFLVAAAIGIGVQAVGALGYPCSWDFKPVEIGHATARAWSVTDTPVSRCLSEGLRFGGWDLYSTDPRLLP